MIIKKEAKMESTEKKIKKILRNTIEMIIDTVKRNNAYFDDEEKKHEYITNVSNNLTKEIFK